jgi:hypothetical protein
MLPPLDASMAGTWARAARKPDVRLTEGLVPLVQRKLGQRLHRSDRAGVVQSAIELAIAPQRRLHGALVGLGLGYVARAGDSGSAGTGDLPRDLFELIRPPRDEYQLRSLGFEQAGGPPALFPSSRP